jgi:hypothetical protein
MHLYKAALIIALACATSPALAIQRDFPTGEPGVNVTYLDAGGPGHPTGCLIAITAGLPVLAVSLSLFSNNTFTLMVASQRQLPKVEPDSSATVKINSVYILSKVTSSGKQGSFYVLNLAPVDNTPMQIAFDAVNHLVFNTARVDIVADDAQIPSVTLPPEPGLGDALTACQRYMVTH